MMEKQKKRIMDMGFVAKLRWTYVIVVLIPILVLGGFAYYSSVSYVKEQKKANLDSTIVRSREYVESVIEQSEMGLKYLSYNNSLLSILSNSKEVNLNEVDSLQEIVLPLCYNVLLSNRNFSKLTIYSQRAYPVGSGIFKQVNAETEQESWYQKTSGRSQIVWELKDEEYIIAKEVSDLRSKEQLGTIKIDIDKANFDFSSINATNIPIEIRIGKGNEFFHYGEVQNADLCESGNLSNGFTFEVYVDPSYLGKANSGLLKTIILVVGCCFILLTGVITVISRALVNRILVLTHAMKNVSEGNFEVQLPVESNDEIGVLYNGFNTLVDKVFHGIMREKELNIKILQAKINPHFLYNTLSTINWLAIQNDQEEIATIITRLSAFYRNTLNQGEDITTIEEEIKNIKSYIALELAIRGPVFTVTYDLDEELLQYSIPNFVLQPLVENAICHGICENQNQEPGILKICLKKIMKQEKDFVEIQIMDNGVGFTKEQQKKIPKAGKGYGLRNVDERLKLYCGNGSGVELTENEYGMTEVNVYLEIK